jgi:SIR2-like protein
VPAPIPRRTRNVYFLGAGFSRALGLPNTAELLTEVHRLAQSRNLAIDRKLRAAYKYFYPEEADAFVPEVVDFFSVLRAYEDVSGIVDSGAPRFPGGFAHPGLLTELRLVVVRLLCDRLRQIQIPPGGWATVEQIVRPGNVIITSNWDLLIEWYASCRGTRLRLGGAPEDKTLTLIKLHGSVDWTEQRFRKAGTSDDDYAVLRELQNSRPPYTIKIKAGDMLRVRAVENMSKSWQFIKARTQRPHMIMMSQGKTVDMGPIQPMWDDAYAALCAASELQIIGYSLPDDDVEIRTLMRAGVTRGNVRPRVIVQNPEPGVHVRVRTYISRDAESDYGAFSPA